MYGHVNGNGELRYECIPRSFLIDECRITELFSDYIVNFVKHVHSMSPDVMTKSCTQFKPARKLLKLHQSSTRAVAHHVSVSHQTVC
ncbi:hypothetical protein TNCV_397601 [Trichonephila clavipes]|nr:hypothetical protein TNCV_397601 [Trichonephila clavipes]